MNTKMSNKQMWMMLSIKYRNITNAMRTQCNLLVEKQQYYLETIDIQSPSNVF